MHIGVGTFPWSWELDWGGCRGQVEARIPVVLAHDATKDAEGNGDQSPDDQDDHNSAKRQCLRGLQTRQALSV